MSERQELAALHAGQKAHSMTMQPKYSGPASEKLWVEVRKIDDIHVRTAVYVFGCAMQDLETRFLQALNDALKQNTKAV